MVVKFFLIKKTMVYIVFYICLHTIIDKYINLNTIVSFNISIDIINN